MVLVLQGYILNKVLNNYLFFVALNKMFIRAPITWCAYLIMLFDDTYYSI